MKSRALVFLGGLRKAPGHCGFATVALVFCSRIRLAAAEADPETDFGNGRSYRPGAEVEPVPTGQNQRPGARRRSSMILIMASASSRSFDGMKCEFRTRKSRGLLGGQITWELKCAMLCSVNTGSSAV